MQPKFTWQYNEFQQVGRDYDSKAEVDKYDSSHADFRDIEAESNNALNLLQVERGDVLVDFGCGTGSFAILAAQRGIRVHAVDISKTMIDYAKRKCDESGVANIEFYNAGFLTYEHKEKPVDAIATSFAFHHLPDFWKGIALKHMNEMLKVGGRLYIHDVIIEENCAIENISALIEKQEAAGGEFLRQDAEEHFRDEYSTYDWVMDGLLSHAGFTVINKSIEGGVIGTYLCEKQTQ